jgi:WD40 repeat protein
MGNEFAGVAGPQGNQALAAAGVDLTRGHSATITHVVRVDDHRVLSAAHDGTTRLWNMDKGTELGTVGRSAGVTACLLYHQALDAAITAGKSPSIDLWPLSPEGIHTTTDGHGGGTTHLLLDADGCVVSAGRDGEVRWWDPRSGRRRPIHRHEDWVTSLAVARAGSAVVSGGRDGMIIVSGGRTKPLAASLRWRGHDSAVSHLLVDGQGVLFSCGADGRVAGWDPDTGRMVAEAVLSSPVTAMVTPQPGLLVLGSAWGGLTVLRLEGH